MRYRLRTLLIALAVGPPLLAIGYWGWGEYVKSHIAQCHRPQVTAEQWREATMRAKMVSSD